MYYLKIVKLYIKYSIRIKLNYKTDFYIEILSYLIQLFMSLIFFEVIFLRKSQLLGWSVNQVQILVATTFIINILYDSLFSESVSRISRIIKNGYLDQYLLYPHGYFFHLSLNKIDLLRLISLLPMIALIVVSLNKLDIDIGFIGIISYLIFLLLAVAIKFSLAIMISFTAVFIVQNMAVKQFFDSLFTPLSYPIQILSRSKLFFPILVIGVCLSNIPVATILDYTTILTTNSILFIIASISIFLLSIIFVKFSLNYYNSGGE
ncbi:MAG: hypothetical protein CSA15_12965 [Candidatus Delongbacteria bacterium]|nr:MAG: hypothetical protein CSA15_12965 [Candidatus Delongbacteria bacterium]